MYIKKKIDPIPVKICDFSFERDLSLSIKAREIQQVIIKYLSKAKEIVIRDEKM